MQEAFESSKLPAWYVAQTHLDSFIIPPNCKTYKDVYLPENQDVLSCAFASGGTLTEKYLIRDNGTPFMPGVRTSNGTWVLKDSVVTLTVAGDYPDFPRKLTYSAATN